MTTLRVVTNKKFFSTFFLLTSLLVILRNDDDNEYLTRDHLFCPQTKKHRNKRRHKKRFPVHTQATLQVLKGTVICLQKSKRFSSDFRHRMIHVFFQISQARANK